MRSLVSLALMWCSTTPGDDPSRVYYGTGTRAFELLIGAILALVLSHPAGFVLRIPKWAWAVAGFIGATVTLLLWVCARQPSPWLYRGGLAGYAVVSCLVIVATIRSGLIRTALSWRGAALARRHLLRRLPLPLADLPLAHGRSHAPVDLAAVRAAARGHARPGRAVGQVPRAPGA